MVVMPPVPAESADVVCHRRNQNKKWLFLQPHRWVIALLCVFFLHCSSWRTFQPAPFPYQPTDLSRGDLAGPYSGSLLDAAGGAIEGGLVRLCLQFGKPKEGSVCFDQKTKVDGSYAFRFAAAERTGRRPEMVRGAVLFAYQPGFIGYRSDVHWDGAARKDFTQRGNKIYLSAFPAGTPHRKHLNFLESPLSTAWLKEAGAREYALAKQEELEAAKPKPPIAPPPPPPMWAEAESVLRGALTHKQFQQAGPLPELVALGADNAPAAGNLKGLSFSGVMLRPTTAAKTEMEKKVFLLIWRTPEGKTSKMLFDRLRRGMPVVKSGEKDVTLVQKILRGGRKTKVLARSAMGHRTREGTVWQLICGTERCVKPADFQMLSSLVRDALRKTPSPAAPAPASTKPPSSTP